MSSVLRLSLIFFFSALLTLSQAAEFPAHWGDPPSEQTDDHVQLPYGYGYGSSTLAQWIETNVKLNRFPNEWGNPPAEQSEDYVQLPGNYGYGSSTLANWISDKLEERQVVYDPEQRSLAQNQGVMSGGGGYSGGGGGAGMMQGADIGQIFSPMMAPMTSGPGTGYPTASKSSSPQATPTLTLVAPEPTPFVAEPMYPTNEVAQPAVASTPISTPNTGTTIINNIYNNNTAPTTSTSTNPAPNTNIISLTAQDQGQTVRTDPSGLIRITLDSNPSTGYAWELGNPSNGAFSVYSNQTFPNNPSSNLPGQPYSTAITLQALKPGTHDVTLVYRRPWDAPDQIAGSFTFRVNVTGDAVTIFDPSATPTPRPTPTAESSPVVNPTPTPRPGPQPSPTAPTPTPETTSTPRPDPNPNPTPEPTPEPTPTPRATPDPNPSPEFTATPGPTPTLPPISAPTPPPILEPGDDKRVNPYGFIPPGRIGDPYYDPNYPDGPNLMVFVFWFNVDTGQSWWANSTGWTPPIVQMGNDYLGISDSWVTGVQNIIISYDPNPYDFGLPKEKYFYDAPEFWLNTSTFEGWWAPSRGFIPPDLKWIKQSEPANYPTKTQFGFLRTDRPASQTVTHYYNIYTGQVVTLPNTGFIPPNIEWRRGMGPGPIRSPRNPYGFTPPNLPQGQRYTYWHNRITEEGWWAPTLGWTPPNNNWTTNLYQPMIGYGNPFGFLPPKSGQGTFAISSWINLFTGQAWTFPSGGYTPPHHNWVEGVKHPLSP